MRARTTTICLLLLVIPAWRPAVANAQDWWQRSAAFRTRFYDVKTDLPADDALHLAKHMDLTVEAYVDMFAGLRAQHSKRPRLELYLFADRRDYVMTLRTRFNASGAGSWGMCISRGKETALVAWQGNYSRGDMESVLQHEGFHQFARYLFPRLPSWANEGLAEVFQRGVAIDGGIVLGEVSIRDILMLAKANQDREFRTFDQFFTMDGRQWNQHVQHGQANTNYLQAWCLVHFFLYADDAKYQPQFLQFLVGLNQELPWERAFVEAFGTPDFAAMQRKWLDYVKQLQPVDYRETIRRLDYLAMGMKQLFESEKYPLSIDELRNELATSQFEYDSNLFGEQRTMHARESRNFEIARGTLPDGRELPSKLPVADIVAEFRLVDADGNTVETPADPQALAKLHRRLARRPLQIVTVGLEPRNLAVTWRRQRKRGLQPVLEAE